MKASILHVVAIVLSIFVWLSPVSAQQPAGWVGIELARGLHGGVLIHGVVPDSPAAGTSLVAGDEVLSIDGVATHTTDELRTKIGAKPVGNRMELEVRAVDGSTKKVIVAPAARPTDVQLARQRLLDKPAPSFLLNVVGKQGAQLGPATFNGHPLLIDFWATWCGPCVHALPGIAELRTRYAARLNVVGVSTEKTSVLVEGVKRLDIKHPILVDAQEAVFRSYGVMVLPTLVLIDSAGIVRAVEVGGNLEAIEAKLRELLIAERFLH